MNKLGTFLLLRPQLRKNYISFPSRFFPAYLAYWMLRFIITLLLQKYCMVAPLTDICIQLCNQFKTGTEVNVVFKLTNAWLYLTMKINGLSALKGIEGSPLIFDCFRILTKSLEVEKVKEYIYLGQLISFDNNLQKTNCEEESGLDGQHTVTWKRLLVVDFHNA